MKITPVNTVLPSPRRGRAGKPRNAPAPRQAPEVVTACGCIVLPSAIGGIGRQAECTEHGWQDIVRRAKAWEIAGIPEPLPYPEDPPY